MEKKTLTVREAAEALGVSTTAVYYLLKTGKLKNQNPDGPNAISQSDVAKVKATYDDPGYIRRGRKPL